MTPGYDDGRRRRYDRAAWEICPSGSPAWARQQRGTVRCARMAREAAELGVEVVEVMSRAAGPAVVHGQHGRAPLGGAHSTRRVRPHVPTRCAQHLPTDHFLIDGDRHDHSSVRLRSMYEGATGAPSAESPDSAGLTSPTG